MSVDTDDDIFEEEDGNKAEEGMNTNENSTVHIKARVATLKNSDIKNAHKSDGEISDEEETSEIRTVKEKPKYSFEMENEYRIDDDVHQRIIGETIAKTMKQLMMDGKLLMDGDTSMQTGKNRSNKNPSQNDQLDQTIKITGKGKNSKNSIVNFNYQKEKPSLISNSNTTIYERVVRDDTVPFLNNPEFNNNRKSSSFEEADMSDETILLQNTNDFIAVNNKTGDLNTQLMNMLQIVDSNMEKVDDSQILPPQPQPGTSQEKKSQDYQHEQNIQESSDDFARKVVREAEQAKACIFDVPGKTCDQLATDLIHSV